MSGDLPVLLWGASFGSWLTMMVMMRDSPETKNAKRAASMVFDAVKDIRDKGRFLRAGDGFTIQYTGIFSLGPDRFEFAIKPAKEQVIVITDQPA